MSQGQWRPSSDKQMLAARAALLREVREFFAARDVLEVDTPVLSSAAGTDPALDPVTATLGGKQYYLQTSPEFAMKRLLAAGSGPIYQLARAFRNGEAGRQHNPEFTMLEWYRPGFTMSELMDEVEALVRQVLDCGQASRITYSELFMGELGIDPLDASLDELRALAAEHVDAGFDSDNPDHWLDLLFSHCLQPALQAPVFITGYPPSQAALARLGDDEGGRKVAMRFELVVGGMELANGYLELCDAAEQRSRFAREIAAREARGLPVYPQDERLLAALESGLPDCSGVALGVDRLLMLRTGAQSIAQVLPFPVDLA